MEVKEMKEQADGSAILVLDLSPEEINSLIQSAIVIGLCEGLKLVEKERVENVRSE